MVLSFITLILHYDCPSGLDLVMQCDCPSLRLSFMLIVLR